MLLILVGNCGSGRKPSYSRMGLAAPRKRDWNCGLNPLSRYLSAHASDHMTMHEDLQLFFVAHSK
eukprot:707219-Rhodomonas_salina.1